jgi:hypothetical protein
MKKFLDEIIIKDNIIKNINNIYKKYRGNLNDY